MSAPLPLTDTGATANGTAEPKLDAVNSAPSTEAALTEPWSVQSVLPTLPPYPQPPPTTPHPLPPPPRASQNHQTRRLAPLWHHLR
ncbi:hypothetical protein ABVK25_000825 [Lepraria finkii]|uniref:Uncharacterized protein n=1 Tax=Lepraria finkii TaxID=1340010 RepID=A0ABR4BP02_9LECA